ncbi:Oligo-1,6-glucosidase [Pillotina sp. SPG140]|jgi:oligo-1,6-glucosidase
MTQWWKEAVVYQIYPRSFQDSNGDGIGDVQGITSRLGYLADLGVDVLWLSPIYASPNVDNGYDISDYQQIMSDFGTMEDFDVLLSRAHEHSIRIVMDLVVNHTSDQHAWFIESRASKDNPKRNWYIWRDGRNGKAPNQLPSVFSGSAWQYDPKTGQYYLHMFAKEQPDLNWDNSEVRNAVFAMMRWWLDKGIDGFRMDVISMISKWPSLFEPERNGQINYDFVHGPHVHDYLREMHEKVLSHYDIMTVGETAGVTIEEAKKYAGFERKELSMVFQFEHMDVDSGPLGKWNTNRFKLPRLKEVLSKWQTGLEGVAWNSLFWNNHDQPRVVSRFGDDLTETSRVKSAKMLATCLHGMQGTPYIYQGEELGMTNTSLKSLEDCRDIEVFNAYRELVQEKKLVDHATMMSYIQKASRDHARTPMQWDSKLNAGFSSGTPWINVNPNYTLINAASQRHDPDSVWNYYRQLIALRKQYPIFVYGTYSLLCPDHEQLFAYTRHYEGKSLLVLCNFSQEPLALPIKVPTPAQVLIANYPEQPEATLLPWEARIYWC